MSEDQDKRKSGQIDDSVEAHKVRDTGELAPADEDTALDESVEGHAVNHRPLDNGGTPSRRVFL